MATRTIANGGGNFSSTSTWVEGIVPTSADNVVATASSGNLTVNVTSNCATFIMTNYVGTLTMNATLIVSGNYTLVSGMTYVGTADLILNAVATITSAGKTLTGGLQFSGSGITVTLADNWTVNGNVTVNLGSGPLLLGNTINVGGNLTMAGGTGGNTTNFVLNGTGTWSGNGTMQNNLTINTAGTITISGAVLFGNGKTLTYTAGTIVFSSAILATEGSNTYNTSGITWPAVRQDTGGMTFTSTFNVTTMWLNLNNNSSTFAGTSGFVCGSLICGLNSISLHSTNTYTISTFFQVSGNPSVPRTINASTGGTRAILTLASGAIQQVADMTATDIDSSAGQTIHNIGGTNSNTLNWDTSPPTGVTKAFTY